MIVCDRCGVSQRVRTHILEVDREIAWAPEMCQSCWLEVTSGIDALVGTSRVDPAVARRRKALADGTPAYPAAAGVDLSVVRKWAQENDVPVSQRGRISADVINQYKAATV